MADQTDTLPAADTNNRFATVTLEYPIMRGETRIESLTVKKPLGGELRGLTLQDLLTTDVSALLKVIPRITNPPLTQPEADALEAEDLAEIGGTIRGFFTTKAERAAIAALIAEHTPKT